MSTIKTGTTLTTAYEVTGDTTGALVIQTGATPTTAVTISDAQVVSLTNALPVSSGGTGATSTSGALSALGALPDTNPSYSGTLTGGTGVVNLGSGQFYKGGSGNVGIGTSSPGQKLSVVGTVESTTGGFKFPDGTTQTTANNTPADATNVLAAVAGASVGAVGTYALLACTSGAVRSAGTTVAGSSLVYANTYTDGTASNSGRSGVTVGGTWRLMGQTGTFNGGSTGTANNIMVSVWLRIS